MKERDVRIRDQKSSPDNAAGPVGKRPLPNKQLLTADQGGGETLPSDLKSRFEGSLSTSLSSVRVHTGPASQKAAAGVGALAYTSGEHIHFASGQYNPGSTAGDRLLAHEVAHTRQSERSQGSNASVTEPGDSVESEARTAADRLVRGEPTAINQRFSGIAREEDPNAKEGDPKAADGNEKDVGDEETEISEEDKAWAAAKLTALQNIKTEIVAVKAGLAGESAFVLAAFDAADSAYTGLEKKNIKAANQLAAKFKKPLADAAYYRTLVDLAIKEAFVIATGGMSSLFQAKSVVQAMLTTAAGLVVSGSAASPKGKAGQPQSAGPTSADWQALFAAARGGWKSFLTATTTLDGANSALDGEIQWLNDIAAGTVEAMPGGKRAKIDEMATAGGKFAGAGGQIMPSGMPIFAAVGQANAISLHKIKQDIAIQWIAKMSPHDIEQIDDTDAELKELGIIDAKDNRLGIDTGDYTSDADQRMVWLRAKVESEVMGVVGTTLQWRGNGKALGRRLWRVSGVSSLEKGRGVVVTGYTAPGNKKLPEQGAASDAAYLDMFRSQYVLTARATELKGQFDPRQPTVEENLQAE